MAVDGVFGVSWWWWRVREGVRGGVLCIVLLNQLQPSHLVL